MNGFESVLRTLGEQGAAIGIAVITALVTTVIVEYSAKPRLEARKARMIRDRQQIDEVIFAFQRAGLAAGTAASMYVERDDPDGLLKEAREGSIAELGNALSAINIAISRLPVRYVSRHGEHLARTARFLGYAKGTVTRASTGQDIGGHALRQIAEDLPLFDTYFVANVEFHDSQEPLIKRWFWKRFTARQYRAEAVNAMDDRYGGDPSARRE